MTAHDAQIEFTCDGDGCYESVYLTCNWYTSGYDIRDRDAERMLDSDHGWSTDENRHYCYDCSQRSGTE